jgi:hypothetical protein
MEKGPSLITPDILRVRAGVAKLLFTGGSAASDCESPALMRLLTCRLTVWDSSSVIGTYEFLTLMSGRRSRDYET